MCHFKDFVSYLWVMISKLHSTEICRGQCAERDANGQHFGELGTLSTPTVELFFFFFTLCFIKYLGNSNYVLSTAKC